MSFINVLFTPLAGFIPLSSDLGRLELAHYKASHTPLGSASWLAIARWGRYGTEQTNKRGTQVTCPRKDNSLVRVAHAQRYVKRGIIAVMKDIGSHLTEGKSKARQTERGELMKYFMEKLNRTRLRSGSRP